MMPTSSISEHQPREKLWDLPVPLWLWDVGAVRIAWANKACLDFSGARSIDDLIRLKFCPKSPFIGQLASISHEKSATGGTRELIRFPTGSGDYIFDCLCRSHDIEPGRAGVLVELVADKGIIVQPARKPVGKSTVNGADHDQNASAHLGQSRPVVIEPKASTPPQVLNFQLGLQVNGFEVETEKVAEEDLRTLEEIARLINGPGNPGLGHGADHWSGAEGDSRPLVARRAQADKAADAGHSACEPLAKRSKKAREAEAKNPAFEPANAERPRSTQSAGGLERNYFLESLPVALAIAMGGRLMRANEAFLYAFGFGSESELRKAGGLAALFPESRDGVLVERQQGGAGRRVAKPARSARLTTLGITRSGRKRRIPIAYRNVSTGREPVQILILHEEALLVEEGRAPGGEIDQTEEGTAHRELGRDSIDFLATVSHEVRTPLNSIIGFSELMKDERFGIFDEKKFRGYAADIHASAMHALSLINDLLDITKIMAGKPDLDFERVALEAVITQAVKSMRPQAERKKITLEVSIDKKLPDLRADRRAMKQILLNILSNAIKFTSPGGRVTIFARSTKRDGVILKITDTGIGMRKDQISTALQPFSQLDTARNRQYAEQDGPEKGTGLGLPVTKALVEAHQARFVIDSTPGQGTSIEIIFPPAQLNR